MVVSRPLSEEEIQERRELARLRHLAKTAAREERGGGANSSSEQLKEDQQREQGWWVWSLWAKILWQLVNRHSCVYPQAPFLNNKICVMKTKMAVWCSWRLLEFTVEL